MPVFESFSFWLEKLIVDAYSGVFERFSVALMTLRFLPFISVLLVTVHLFRAKKCTSCDLNLKTDSPPTGSVTNDLLRAKRKDIVKAWFCRINDGLYLPLSDNVFDLSA